MASALFILDLKGKVLIARNYRGDVPMTCIEEFMPLVVQSEDEELTPGPIISTALGLHFLYIRHNNLYLVAMTKRNTDASVVLLFLHKIVQVFINYFKELEEESIRDNFVIIYELMDEMMDFGYPQITESKILQEYITQESYKLEKQSRPPMAVTNAVSWRSEGLKYRKNEVFLDVIESVNLLVNANGNIVRSEILGSIKMRCFLSGMPDVRLGLNDKLMFENTGKSLKGKSVEMEDVKFHQCVRLSRFENDRTISFIPPDGEFELMSYRLNTEVKPLIWTDVVIEQHSGSRVEYMIKAKSQFKRRSNANDVEISVFVPDDADSPRFKCNVGYVEYRPEKQSFVWHIKSFAGGKEYLCRAHFGLPSVKADPEKRPPISIKFEMPYFTVSGIQVRYLKVVDKSGYQAFPWVRYITQNGDYLLRLPLPSMGSNKLAEIYFVFKLCHEEMVLCCKKILLEMTHGSKLDSQRQRTQALIKEKDEIESSIQSHETVLRSNNVDMHTALIDKDGFPRSDLDIYAIRQSRSALSRLYNDLKSKMDEIHKELELLHHIQRQEQKETPVPIEIKDPIPFARVNSVENESPAFEAGLAVNDLIFSFGDIDYRTVNALQVLGATIKDLEHRSVRVWVLRQNTKKLFNIVPKSWGGRASDSKVTKFVPTFFQMFRAASPPQNESDTATPESSQGWQFSWASVLDVVKNGAEQVVQVIKEDINEITDAGKELIEDFDYSKVEHQLDETISNMEQFTIKGVTKIGKEITSGLGFIFSDNVDDVEESIKPISVAGIISDATFDERTFVGDFQDETVAAKFKYFRGSYDHSARLDLIHFLRDTQPAVFIMKDSIVPLRTSEEEFWARYFFMISTKSGRTAASQVEGESDLGWSSDNDEETPKDPGKSVVFEYSGDVDNLNGKGTPDSGSSVVNSDIKFTEAPIDSTIDNSNLNENVQVSLNGPSKSQLNENTIAADDTTEATLQRNSTSISSLAIEDRCGSGFALIDTSSVENDNQTILSPSKIISENEDDWGSWD